MPGVARYEPFTAADSTLLAGFSSNGTTWTEHPNTSNSVGKIQSNKLINKNANASYYYTDYVPQTADYEVMVDATYRSKVGTGATFFLGIRFSTSQYNKYRLYWSDSSGTGKWALQAVWNNGGSASELGTYTATPSANTTYNLRITAYGSTIKAYIDGTERISGTDTNVTAAGRAGLTLANGTTSSSAGFELDNYYIIDPYLYPQRPIAVRQAIPRAATR